MATNTKPTKPTTSLDFSKVFSTNSPATPFTWTDSDYLEGWSSIQMTPPSRQQFDALQKHSDEKENWLFNNYLESYADKYLDYLDTVKAPKHSPTFTGDPKAPTPPWNDNDTSIATTAFVQHWVDILQDNIDNLITGSVGGTGYVKLDNGFILQWGKKTVSSDLTTPITLPTSFSNTNWGIVGSHITFYAVPTVVCFDGTTKTNSQILAGIWDLFSSSWIASDFYFIAAGY